VQDLDVFTTLFKNESMFHFQITSTNIGQYQ